jgi:hypothetical protein
MSFSGEEFTEILKRALVSPADPGAKPPEKFLNHGCLYRRVLAHFGYKIRHFNAPGLMSAAASFQTNFSTFDLKICQ